MAEIKNCRAASGYDRDHVPFVMSPFTITSVSIPSNIVTDKKTVAAMVHIYCHDKHGSARGALCEGCDALLAYSHERLDKCPFEEEKTTCRDCPIHCYRPMEKDAMKEVMRYAGPRMVLRHPLLAIRHLWLERKGAPPWPPKRRRSKTIKTA